LVLYIQPVYTAVRRTADHGTLWWSGITLVLRSRGFKSRPGGQRSWPLFVVILQITAGIATQLGGDRFLSHLSSSLFIHLTIDAIQSELQRASLNKPEGYCAFRKWKRDGVVLAVYMSTWSLSEANGQMSLRLSIVCLYWMFPSGLNSDINVKGSSYKVIHGTYNTETMKKGQKGKRMSHWWEILHFTVENRNISSFEISQAVPARPSGKVYWREESFG
jgi:hypothetical protein